MTADERIWMLHHQHTDGLGGNVFPVALNDKMKNFVERLRDQIGFQQVIEFSEVEWMESTKPINSTEVKETNTPQRHPTFQEELEHLINCHSIENESDTPDFILAEYLRNCLTTWRTATRRRDNWYGHKTLNTGSLKSNSTQP